MSGKAVLKLIGLVTPLKLISIVPQEDRAFASWIAARNVQTAPGVAHTPSPGVASLASPLSFTVKVIGQGIGVGVGVGVGVGLGGGPLGGTFAHHVPHRLLFVVCWLSLTVRVPAYS